MTNLAEMFNKAFEMCVKAHNGQYRKGSNLPYCIHPMRVFNILEGSNSRIRIASILHDTVEDTDITLEDIEIIFGNGVSDLVEELTNPSKKDMKELYGSKLAYQKQALVKMSEEALIVKLADRLDNISDEPSKQYKTDTLELLNYVEVNRSSLKHETPSVKLIFKIKEVILKETK